MPLWMQLLVNGGILQNPADGEGGDLGGGQSGESKEPEQDPPKEPEQDPPKEPEQDPPKESNDGKKKPTDQEAELLKEVMKRKEKERALTQELNDLKAKVGDLNLDEVRQLIQERRNSETKALEDKGEYERVKQRMAEEHANEVSRLNQEIQTLKDKELQYGGQINELTVGARFSQSQYVAEELTLTPSKARALYGNHFELEEGQIVGYDKPRGASNRTQLIDSYGNPLSFDIAMQKIIEADPERDSLIRSKAKPGAGSSPKNNAKTPQAPQNLSSREKIAQGLQGLK